MLAIVYASKHTKLGSDSHGSPSTIMPVREHVNATRETTMLRHFALTLWAKANCRKGVFAMRLVYWTQLPFSIHTVARGHEGPSHNRKMRVLMAESGQTLRLTIRQVKRLSRLLNNGQMAGSLTDKSRGGACTPPLRGGEPCKSNSCFQPLKSRLALRDRGG